MKQVNCGSCENRGCTRQYLHKGTIQVTVIITCIMILSHFLDKKKSHLRTSYDFAHLADLAPVVQKMDNPIQSINLYPVDSAFD